jgi:hypothetical protein
VTAAGPYCPDAQCIEDECSPAEPCCISICTCAIAEDHCAYARNTGDVFEDFDGTMWDVWYCGEHKKEWLK